jgi:hypothetical protein
MRSEEVMLVVMAKRSMNQGYIAPVASPLVSPVGALQLAASRF